MSTGGGVRKQAKKGSRHHICPRSPVRSICLTQRSKSADPREAQVPRAPGGKHSSLGGPQGLRLFEGIQNVPAPPHTLPYPGSCPEASGGTPRCAHGPWASSAHGSLYCPCSLTGLSPTQRRARSSAKASVPNRPSVHSLLTEHQGQEVKSRHGLILFQLPCECRQPHSSQSRGLSYVVPNRCQMGWWVFGLRITIPPS